MLPCLSLLVGTQEAVAGALQGQGSHLVTGWLQTADVTRFPGLSDGGFQISEFLGFLKFQDHPYLTFHANLSPVQNNRQSQE